MGVYDMIDAQFYCYYCGTLQKIRWQTKDGERSLTIFPSIDNFFEKNSIGMVELHGQCYSCQKWLRISVENSTKKYRRVLQRNQMQRRETKRKEQEDSHPNHGVMGSYQGKPVFDNGSCHKCLNVLRINAGEPPPDMSYGYLADAKKQALEEQKKLDKKLKKLRESLDNVRK